MSSTLKTYPWESQFGGRPVSFRFLQSEDKELFKNFIRSLPDRDNFYLLLDVNDDLGIDHWMRRVESGHTQSVIAIENDQMIGYCNLHMNQLPWIRHVGEIRMSVAGAHRGRGLGRTLANEIFAIAQAHGLEKLWARMAASQEAAQKVFKSLGFRTEALLSDFVKNESGLTEDLVIMSYDAAKRWGL
jgi:ribosomal protein S18 acetylase RimI-like enzyme